MESNESHVDSDELKNFAVNVDGKGILEKFEVKYIQDPEELWLKKNVILAYSDICAAGSRALLGIDHRMIYFDVKLPELKHQNSTCLRDVPANTYEKDFLPFQVLNCKYEEFSLVVVNCILSPTENHHVASRILDLCIQCKVTNLTIASAIMIDPRTVVKNKQGIYEAAFFTEKRTKLHPIPKTAMIQGGFLSSLMQMILIGKVPTNMFLVPGTKAFNGKANVHDGSIDAISLLQDVLSDITGLRFKKSSSYNLIYYNPSATSGAATHIYG